MKIAVAALLLAASGAATAAEKDTAIDWPARAAMVKIGMTRSEVEKILPVRRWISSGGGHASLVYGYMVSEDWLVHVTYRIVGSHTAFLIAFLRNDTTAGEPQVMAPVKITKIDAKMRANPIYKVDEKPKTLNLATNVLEFTLTIGTNAPRVIRLKPGDKLPPEIR